MFVFFVLIAVFSALPLPDCRDIRSREPVVELVVPPIGEVDDHHVSTQTATTTREPLRRQLRWQNELRFEGQLESGLKWIARILDPFNLLLQFDAFQLEMKRIIVLAILFITLLYNLFIMIVGGYIIIQMVILLFYLLRKIIRFFGKIVKALTLCLQWCPHRGNVKNPSM